MIYKIICYYHKLVIQALNLDPAALTILKRASILILILGIIKSSKWIMKQYKKIISRLKIVSIYYLNKMKVKIQ